MGFIFYQVVVYIKVKDHYELYTARILKTNGSGRYSIQFEVNQSTIKRIIEIHESRSIFDTDDYKRTHSIRIFYSIKDDDIIIYDRVGLVPIVILISFSTGLGLFLAWAIKFPEKVIEMLRTSSR